MIESAGKSNCKKYKHKLNNLQTHETCLNVTDPQLELKTINQGLK